MATPLQQQAAAYANAAVPTLGSINSQYNQSQGDVHNFTAALVRLLQAGGQTDPYAGAVGSQQAANSAAVQRLQALGSPYAAGSAAAVGGMGDSALGSLNQQRGAAIQYQRQLPGIAAARGELANSSLISARHTALDQRNQQYQSAYMQALQQLRDYGLQKQQLKQSAQQFAAQQRYQYAALQQNQAQFNQRQAQQFSEFMTQQQNALKAAAGGDPATAARLRQEGAAASQTYVLHGIPFMGAVRDLMHAHSINRKLAIALASEAYSMATKPTRAEFTDKNGVVNQPGFSAAMRAYTRAFNSFRYYSLHGWGNKKKASRNTGVRITASNRSTTVPKGFGQNWNQNPYVPLNPQGAPPPGTRIGGGTYP